MKIKPFYLLANKQRFTVKINTWKKICMCIYIYILYILYYILIKHEWISFWIAVILAQWTVSLLRRVTVTVIMHSLECYVTVFWSLVSGCRSVCLCSGIEFSLPLLEEKRKSRERSESGQTEGEGWVQDRSPLMGCWSAFSAHQCIRHLLFWQIKWA